MAQAGKQQKQNARTDAMAAVREVETWSLGSFVFRAVWRVKAISLTLGSLEVSLIAFERRSRGRL